MIFPETENKKQRDRDEGTKIREKTSTSFSWYNTYTSNRWVILKISTSEKKRKKEFDVHQGNKYALVSKTSQEQQKPHRKKREPIRKSRERKWKSEWGEHTWKLTKWKWGEKSIHTTQWRDPTNTHRKYAHGINKSLVRWYNKQTNQPNTVTHIAIWRGKKETFKRMDVKTTDRKQCDRKTKKATQNGTEQCIGIGDMVSGDNNSNPIQDCYMACEYLDQSCCCAAI